jgi:hypothetical protein
MVKRRGEGRRERHVMGNERREIDIWWWREEGRGGERDMWWWMGEGRWIYDSKGKRERSERHVMVKGRGGGERYMWWSRGEGR